MFNGHLATYYIRKLKYIKYYILLQHFQKKDKMVINLIKKRLKIFNFWIMKRPNGNPGFKTE